MDSATQPDSVAPSDDDDPSRYENILRLPANRQLHYASAGNVNSSLVALFFAGYFSIGTASQSTLPRPLAAAGAHYIAPTLPGNGESSSTPKGVPYYVNLCKTITELLEDLHPSDGSKGNAIERLFLGGGSYGSVPCQMLYGASYDLFPYGRSIAGMILAAPFSPFKHDTKYTRDMTWSNWVFVGPPSQWVPFRLIPRCLSTIIAVRCEDLKGARGMLDLALFSKMDAAEKEQLKTFARDKRGMTAEQFIDQMAEGALRCTRNWDGFIEGPDVLHSDWGFEPAKLDKEHSNSRRKVVIVQSEADELGEGMVEWLSENYAYAELKKIQGGHLAALYHLDELWAEMLATE